MQHIDRPAHDRTQVAARALRLMDLTSLNATDTEVSIRALAASAATQHGAPAALCVYARFVPAARQALDAIGLHAVGVAAVANFSEGQTDLAAVLVETADALKLGANEVDVVFPWRALMAGDAQAGRQLVAACKETIDGRGLLKVILETGELKTPALIREAADIAIAAGADFIKTSTGKVAVNATHEAAETMLEAIRDAGGTVGFKAAGGVRTVDDAARYIGIAERVLGAGWVSPRSFRFGASGLLGALLAELDGAPAAAATSAY